MIPIWKKFLSYFFTISLEKAIGKNSTLELVLSKGRWQLSTDKVIYSWQDLYYPFATSFQKLNADLKNVESCLVIGMGMASIPEILNLQLQQKKINYVGIEAETIIINWAKKYLPNSLNQQINWINNDAEKAVYHLQNQFDLICVDVFVHRIVPEFALQINFIEQCKKLLNPNGLLLFNVLPDDIDKQINFKQNFSSVFNSYKIISIHQNQIFVGYKQ
jgi:SAM-dependent methyltransferase